MTGETEQNQQVPNDKNLKNQWKKGPWLFSVYIYIYRDEILPSYVGIIINHYIDTARIPCKQQWKVRSFFCGSCVLFSVVLKKGMVFFHGKPMGMFCLLKINGSKVGKNFLLELLKKEGQRLRVDDPMKHHPPASLHFYTLENSQFWSHKLTVWLTDVSPRFQLGWLWTGEPSVHSFSRVYPLW